MRQLLRLGRLEELELFELGGELVLGLEQLAKLRRLRHRQDVLADQQDLCQDQLDLMLPEPGFSPIELHKLRGKQRLRARHKKGAAF